MITWDETQRLRNFKDHGLDFIGCEAVFYGPVVAWDDDRESYGELRINLLGFLNGIIIHMTYTERDDDVHVISLRKAEKNEIKRFAKGLSR